MVTTFRLVILTISIHALLAESDAFDMAPYMVARFISIHALLAESDFLLMWYQCNTVVFLSTLSLRRATAGLHMCLQPATFLSTLSLRRATSLHRLSGSSSSNFYPRSPCGERLRLLCPGYRCYHISIHALLAESDCWQDTRRYLIALFLSTLSLRRATVTARIIDPTYGFLSTLSLRRATRVHQGRDRSNGHFYPRSPCGERPKTHSWHFTGISFLSTLSLRRATVTPMVTPP